LRVREDGEGAPLLLIHGLGANLEMWGPVVALFPDRRRITVDLPGTGRSTTPLVPLPIVTIARMLERVLDLVDADGLDVVGYSFGGAVAQQLVRQAPSRVRRLVLVSTTCGWGAIPGRLSAILMLSVPARYYSPWIYERTYAWTAGGRRPSREKLLEQAALRSGLPPSFTGYLWQMIGASAWSSLPWLGTISTPTLVVCGSEDPMTPLPNAILLASKIPDARLQVAPGEGHLLLFDDESVALPTMREFLTAPDLTTASRWVCLAKPSAADCARAIAEHGWGGAPYGALSAAFRGLIEASR
jgi:pimeloyl-ACP methyl ester carboxylesterase